MWPHAIVEDACDDSHCPWFVLSTPLDVDLIAEFTPLGFELRTYEGYRGLVLSIPDYTHGRVVSWLTHMVAALGRGFTVH